MCVNTEMLRRAVKEALEQLRVDDRYLYESDVNERSLSHRLAVYLERSFPGWNIDCEYNRNVDDPKRLELPPRNDVSSTDMHARTVYPDIIVHRRMTGENLLVIEIKKSSSKEPDQFDLKKLSEYKRVFNYRHAMFIKLMVGDKFGRKDIIKCM